MHMSTRHSGPSQFVSRRRWLAQSLAAAGGIAFPNLFAAASTVPRIPQSAPNAPGGEISHDAESIHQQVLLPISSDKIYDVLTNAAQFQKLSLFSPDIPPATLTSHPAQLSNEPGSAFTLFGGNIEGRQIELVPAKRVVQAWRVADWAPGLYSIARFELLGNGNSTKIIFDHTGFPRGAADHLAAGWRSHYWNGIMKLFTAPKP
jgi:activator of HSP90 ATPase